jgi:ribosomal protein L29
MTTEELEAAAQEAREELEQLRGERALMGDPGTKAVH